MAQVDILDIAVLVVILLGTALYLSWGTLFGSKSVSPDEKYKNGFGKSSSSPTSADSRDITATLEKNEKDVIIFYGSQTGTAEDYASRLAKEASQVYGLKTMTASLEDYDFENLDTIPSTKIVGFVLATYGEGEPTDSAFSFFEYITAEGVEFSQGSSLENLKYIVFGLGNSTYEHYNAVGRKINGALKELGATRIGPYGEGDDGSGTMEEDYLAWKDDLFSIWKEAEGLEEREAVYEPVLKVVPLEDADESTVYLGEPNKSHLLHTAKPPYTATNPYIAPIVKARELFNSPDRNCIHLELDISNSGLKYLTGDHLALLPQNSDEEVTRFLKIFSLANKKNEVIDVKTLDPTTKVPFPVPTTYDAVVRYHLEINGPVSRQFLSSIAPFAPTEEAKKTAQRLGSSKEDFAAEVGKLYLNIARILGDISKGQPWDVPFSFIVESVNRIVPRYYSISSSSKETPNTISITAVVESIRPKGTDHVLKGVATNYILDLKNALDGTKNTDPSAVHYQIKGPRGILDGKNVFAYVRHSSFKLPSNPKKPVIMIGPGTGVAPFRGFVHERAHVASQGTPVGPTLLFFGCRSSKDDFLYQEEWAKYSQDTPKDLQGFVEAQAEASTENKKYLNDTSFLKVVTAFSREGPKKVYVQHRLEENAKLVNTLLKQGAFFYVCGDAMRMARDVQTTLIKIISQERGISLIKAEEIVKNMRTQNLYQEDVW